MAYLGFLLYFVFSLVSVTLNNMVSYCRTCVCVLSTESGVSSWIYWNLIRTVLWRSVLLLRIVGYQRNSVSFYCIRPTPTTGEFETE